VNNGKRFYFGNELYNAINKLYDFRKAAQCTFQTMPDIIQ